MSALDEAPHVQCETRAEWRAWLAEHHTQDRGIWLVTWKRGSGRPVLGYEEVVEEALCFGWIDGQVGSLDDARRRLYLAPRRPGSVWAGTNKARVERLTAAGLMAPAGLAAIARAREDGSWSALDAIEREEVPDDLAAALAAHPPAAERFAAFSGSVRRMILAWIATAKRPETRVRRIAETAERAARGERPGPAAG